MSLLELDNVSVDLGHTPRVRVLDDVSLVVRPGEVVGIVGESGSGKTTLARTILRAIDPAAGSVTIDGQDVTRLRGSALRRWRRGGTAQYVFQDPLRSLDPAVRVGDSIVEGLRVARIDATTSAERLARALTAVGLDESLMDRLPADLSGGQRQRAAIARALVVDPRLLVLDEPVSALDASSRDRVVRALVALRDARRDRLGMIVISHDIGSLAAISDRIVVLYRGRVVEDGLTRRVVRAPQHPYTRLLIASVPLVTGSAGDPAERARLRALVDG